MEQYIIENSFLNNATLVIGWGFSLIFVIILMGAILRFRLLGILFFSGASWFLYHNVFNYSFVLTYYTFMAAMIFFAFCMLPFLKPRGPSLAESRIGMLIGLIFMSIWVIYNINYYFVTEFFTHS